MKIAASVLVALGLFAVQASAEESFVYVDHWPSGQAGETFLAVTVPAGEWNSIVLSSKDSVSVYSVTVSPYVTVE